MSYQNNEYKLVCVVNRTIPLPRAMNALAHATTGLVGDLTAGAVELLDYANEDEGFTARISRWPFIVLQAKNSSQLRSLRLAADEKLIPHNLFVSTMIGSSAEEQLSQTYVAAAADIEFWAVALFGSTETLQPLTKKFSVFSGATER